MIGAKTQEFSVPLRTVLRYQGHGRQHNIVQFLKVAYIEVQLRL